MSYKSIVSASRDVIRDGNTLQTAASIAQAQDGHLSVICLGIDRVQVGAYYAGANAVALQQSIEAAKADAEICEKEARKLLGAQSASWDVSALAAQTGNLGHLIAGRAQFADLVVLSKPYGDGCGPEDVAVLESALFGTRVPVLVLPTDYSAAFDPGRIVIAWNQSPEALAAIRASLPLLSRASAVDICIIDPPSHGEDRSDPGGDLAEMLSRHAVRADITVLAKTLPRVSDVICRHCTDFDADLVVMGAYGHSRLREAILGGATRNMLEAASLPVLMAH